MQRINQSIIESRLIHALWLSQSRSAKNIFTASYVDRDSIEPYDSVLPSDHIIWSRGDFPLLSRSYQKKAPHTFEICWQYPCIAENKEANILLKMCLKEWNQRLILESRWIEWVVNESSSFSSDRTRIFANISYDRSHAHLALFREGLQMVVPNEWFGSPRTTSIFSSICTFFSR